MHRRTVLTTLSAGLILGPAFLASLPAQAAVVAEDALKYTLTWKGRPAGTLALTIRHFAPRTEGGDETRIIESLHTIGGDGLAQAHWRRTRATARVSGSTISFTAVTEVGLPGSQDVVEVNGRRHSDGRWSLSITRDGNTTQQELRRSQADLCTLDLYDPHLHVRISDRPVVRLLDVASGTIASGTTEDLGEVVIEVAGAEVPARRRSIQGDTLAVQGDWTLAGLPVRLQTTLAGGPLIAQVDALPKPRSWGEVDVSTRFDNGVKVDQDDL